MAAPFKPARRLFLASALICLPWAAIAEPYRLFAQDRLLIRIMTWDYSQNSLTGWQDLSGEYSISPEGELRLPLVGMIKAEGLTQAELGEALSQLLHRRAGLEQPPELSVELVSSLPVYMLGAVEARGAVDFRPGLTVRQAFALAGGLPRAQTGADPARSIALSGEIASARDRLKWLRAEKERLEGELDELEGIAAPSAEPRPESEFQTRLQFAEQQARDTRIESYDLLEQLLVEREDRLTKQMVLRDQQIAASKEQLEGITSLNEKGLAVNARVTALAATLSDQEAKRLELETAMILLDEQLNQAARERDTISTDARAERLRRLVDLEAEIAAGAIQVSSLEAQYAALTGLLPQGPTSADQEAPEFLLYRDGSQQPAQPETQLQPGDTLEVRLPSPDAGADMGSDAR
ncbi:polysaccharide biosynthesis/export family protein [Paracoccus sp. SCSIO 75233]|uniref:polysaccharide biosynthesis/export family protein n=1 Tax=Paracoccus sp. SCSIO 75233 TaxID=3017782 RepID=UPI0022F0C0CB|nr:polysaccharide biosynthesis/export family protein [Paracoccus sp. SCSIO 75233]WBU52628.1 polysaccharide biosynthesis/export family protein [Paracoccus sp. SCSIO 75233]